VNTPPPFPRVRPPAESPDDARAAELRRRGWVGTGADLRELHEYLQRLAGRE
jgi:hypothetical protein